MLTFSPNLKNSDRILHNRREKESKSSSLLQKVTNDLFLQERVKFEQKADKINHNREIIHAKSLSNQLRISTLSQRKQKLFQLFTKEFDGYKKELFSLENTSENQRNYMISRVKNIQETKENNRKAFVDQQIDRLFLQNNEDIRNIMTERNKFETIQALQSQIVDNQRNLVEKYEENLIFDEMMKRKINKEAQKTEEKRKEYEKLMEKNTQSVKYQIVIH